MCEVFYKNWLFIAWLSKSTFTSVLGKPDSLVMYNHTEPSKSS